MRTHVTRYPTSTRDALDFVDVTGLVETAVTTSGINAGQVSVVVGDSESALLVNENEAGLLQDLKGMLERLRVGDSSDRRAFIGSTSVVLPAMDGVVLLGTWQRVLLVELGAGGERAIVVQIVGD